MISKKVELLAPAGNYACFIAAMNAGADAVYIGGSKYGARAYADNFSEEEIIEAIHVAHLLKRKLYMTVNTLVKNQELDGLVEFMTPYYEAGLDGVIIQDFGVFQTLKNNFPGLELHASTQMTLTGKYGAELLKSLGACRIVPARELSFDEIREIKANVDIEIEAFIHGAMCYAYSGQCLFSSILGGRSGNRGRCAGPCRLPYEVKLDEKKTEKNTTGKNKKEDIYPLSLKDMYTLRSIPELIESGIDSFKIEGRMKSPEYVAGVTSVYRKYIDQYLQHPEQKFEISKQDEEVVTGLYIRSGLQEGYYHKHNGKDMVTLQGPGYAGTKDAIIAKIQEQYLKSKPQLPVYMKGIFHKDQLCKLFVAECESDLQQLIAEDSNKDVANRESGYGIGVQGDMVQMAQNRPMTEGDIEKQLMKMGDTYFKIEKLSLDVDEHIFIPIKSINELRRLAVSQYQNYLLQKMDAVRNMQASEKETTKQENGNILNEKSQSVEEKQCANVINIKSDVFSQKEAMKFSAFVANESHLRICLRNKTLTHLYIDADLLCMHPEILEYLSTCNQKRYLAFPYILRKRSYRFLTEYQNLLNLKNKETNELIFAGALIRNLETLQWLKDIDYTGEKIADANIYAWNNVSKELFNGLFDQLTVPTELNRKERKHLPINDMEAVVYGRIPMMYSANCTRKTVAKCTSKSGYDDIIDRYKNTFPIYHNCRHCYNVIYNTVPLSLHQYIDEMIQEQVKSIRLEFTNESTAEIEKVLTYYTDIYQTLMRNSKENKTEKNTVNDVFGQGTYTTGHYKRGVE